MRFPVVILFLLTTAVLLAAQNPAAPGVAAASLSSSTETASQPPSSQSSEQAPVPSEPSASPAPAVPVSASAPPVGTPIVAPEGPKEIAEAKRQFRAGVKLKSSGKPGLALEKFERASELNPHNIEYLTVREFTRQQLVMEALDRGNQAMLKHDEIVAMAEFRRALEYDPGNDFALQRLRESLPEPEPVSPGARIVESSTPIELQPSTAHHDFHFRGDARALLTDVAQAYGIHAEFDDSLQQRRVLFDIEDVNFATAMLAAMHVTKTFWVPLSATQVFFAADTLENRRVFERMVLRTFYLPEVQDQQLTEIANSLRVLLNIRFVGVEKSQSTITIRAESSLAEAAARIVESVSGPRPEVMLDMRIYEISSSLLRQIGTTWPQQFTLFNISPALIAGLGAGGQNLINQLIASGGINQANSQAISALLAQLSNQSSSLLQTPFATFGGGVTLFGLNAGGSGTTVKLNVNESDVRSLDHVTLRASQNNAAEMKIGERYPIVNATFAPVYNNSAISRVLGNQSYIAPFPSFNFEDLGVNLKATPVIHSDSAVSLKLELQIRSLGTQTVNGIPVINNREYTGNITLKNGESGVVAGLISMADTRSINGYPFLSRVPALTYAASEHDKNVQQDELLIVITPHIARMLQDNSFALQMTTGN